MNEHEIYERKLSRYICRLIEKDVGNGVNEYLKRVYRAIEKEKMKKKLKKTSKNS